MSFMTWPSRMNLFETNKRRSHCINYGFPPSLPEKVPAEHGNGLLHFCILRVDVSLFVLDIEPVL